VTVGRLATGRDEVGVAERARDGMKMLVAVVRDHDVDLLLGALSGRGFHAMVVDRRSSPLGERNGTVLLGVQERYLAEAVEVVRAACPPGPRLLGASAPVVEPSDTWAEEPILLTTGGVSLLVLDLARYERIT
jgi:uncharacterized protein YaaQ